MGDSANLDKSGGTDGKPTRELAHKPSFFVDRYGCRGERSERFLKPVFRVSLTFLSSVSVRSQPSRRGVILRLRFGRRGPCLSWLAHALSQAAGEDDCKEPRRRWNILDGGASAGKDLLSMQMARCAARTVFSSSRRCLFPTSSRIGTVRHSAAPEIL